MLYWYALAVYVVITFVIFPFAESARQTRMRLKRVISIPLIALIVATLAVLVPSAMSDVHAGSRHGLLKLALIEAPLLVGLLLLRPIQRLGRRIGHTASGTQGTDSWLLRLLMEPMNPVAPSQEPTA